jgi:menaquinol-cytochrome c reductase iron-sulfur subunit
MSTPGSREKGRRALIMAAAAGTCAIAVGAGAPAAALVLAPLRAGGSTGRWVRTLRLEQLRENEPKRVAIVSDRRDAWTVEKNVELGSVWLVKRGDKVFAFSAVCPHLGCSINATAKGDAFACPCHTSAFDADGKRKSGPAPRDMDSMQTKVEDGFVAVDFRRFRIGVAEKVET